MMKILYFFDKRRKALIAVDESIDNGTHAYELTPLPEIAVRKEV